MPRPNFDITIRGDVLYYVNDVLSNSASRISRAAEEQYTGVARRKPKGWIPPTRYDFDRTVRVSRNGLKIITPKSSGSKQMWSGPIGGDGIASDPNRFDECLSESELTVSSAMRDQAIIIARSKMKRGDLNLAVAFAERKKTALLVADTATAFVKSVRALRRGNWREAWRQLKRSDHREPRGKTIPNKWLEMQYGWRPMLSDVYGSVDALSRNPPDNWIVTGTGAKRESLNRVKVNTGSDPCDVMASGWKGVFVRIDAVPQNDLLMALSSLGITNPALVAWELIPFSFVADWLLPVGSYLESLDAMLGYGPTWCSISTFAKCNWRVTGTSSESTVSVTRYACQDGTKERVILHRSALTSVPLPTLPRLRDPRSLNRMASALSLLVGVFGRR